MKQGWNKKRTGRGHESYRKQRQNRRTKIGHKDRDEIEMSQELNRKRTRRGHEWYRNPTHTSQELNRLNTTLTGLARYGFVQGQGKDKGKPWMRQGSDRKGNKYRTRTEQVWDRNRTRI